MDEDRALHLGLIGTGGPPVAIALAHGAQLGTGPTMAGLVLLAGLVGLLRGFGRDDAVLPRARWRKRRS